MIRFLLLTISIISSFHNDIKSQGFNVNFIPTTKTKIIDQEEVSYITLNEDTVLIEECKFYVSNIRLSSSEGIIFAEKNGFHLIDIKNPKSFNISLQKPSGCSFDKILFDLGIDSLTNSAGVLGGDLDPTLGMYWTWQSGYINVKIEGKSPKCKTRNNKFTFHLGGYRQGELALQTVMIQAPSNDHIDIFLDLNQFLGNIDLGKQNHIMSPSIEAIALSKLATYIFTTRLW